ncbi:MAG: sigma-70 family RNA polymerase sigma factor [Bacteroidales bacterium]|nr:sigma-70 family RNA polymerase sigma factor [Bacteroidales bacterium]
MTEKDSGLEEIVNGCLNNNRLSQRKLYDRYAPSMFAVCRRYANTDSEAEDMLMEGFMKVFKSIGSFKGESAFTTWVHSVMLNAAISHYRSIRKFRHEVSECDLDVEAEVNEEERIATSMDARRVLELMQKMPEPLRVIFNLRAVEGFSFAEIAKELGTKEDSMRVTFLRARKWMLAELE